MTTIHIEAKISTKPFDKTPLDHRIRSDLLNSPILPNRSSLDMYMLDLLRLAQLLVARRIVHGLLHLLRDRQDSLGAIENLGDLFEQQALGLGVVKVDHDDRENDDGDIHAIVLPRERT